MSSSARPQDIGPEFEAEFIERHGLKPVAASGSQWHSKLDARGHGARWSLKATADRSYRITALDMLEAVEACHGAGGTGEMPLMAIKLMALDDPIVLVVMLEEDFMELATGEMTLVSEDRTAAKRRVAATPELLREDENGD